jgi:hypothetical protein
MKNYQLIAFALIMAISVVACKKKEEPVVAAPAPIETAPTPVASPAPVAATASVTSLTLGNSLAADGKSVTAAANAFGAKDSIHAAVATATSDAAATVNGKLYAKWTYQDGQIVNEENRDLAFTGPDSTVFTISNPDPWPLGKYKIEVSLDGAVVQSQEFEIK